MNLKNDKLTKEVLRHQYQDYLTVGKLRQFLANADLPDEANVVVERVEDCYYNNGGWSTLLKEGEYTLRDKNGELDEETMIQYSPAFCCVKYPEDEVLFINMHY